MAVKFKRLDAALTASGDNTLVTPAAVGEGKELYIRRLWAERTDTAADVTLIFKNTASPAVEVWPRVTLNADAGKMLIQLDDDTEVGCGAGRGLVVNASAANKARGWIGYRIGEVTPEP